MSLLITIADIQKYRPISATGDRVDVYIQEAQMNDLRPSLGDGLYYDFITKVNSSGDDMYSAYQNLLKGTTYTYNGNTIQYPGIVPVLVYYTLKRFVKNNQIHLTGMGVVRKLNGDQSENLDIKAINMQVGEFADVARSYELQMRQFLIQNTATYTLYYAPYAPNRGSLNFFKA